MAGDLVTAAGRPLVADRRFRFEGRSVAWGRIGSGPALVLVHGTPFSSQVWRRIAPCLAPHWTVHFYDMPGYGLSDMTPGADVSLGIQNRVLAALFREWGLSEPDVICHDFGAATVLRAHYLDGLRYNAVLVFDAVALAPWGSPFVSHVRLHEAAFAGMPGFAHDALVRAYVQGAAHGPLLDEVMDIHVAPWLGPRGQSAFYRQIAQMDTAFTDAVAPRYGRFARTVQVMWGVEDTWIPIETGRRFAQMVSDRGLVEVADCGHLMQEDAPEAIVAAMLSLRIGAHAGRAGSRGPER